MDLLTHPFLSGAMQELQRGRLVQPGSALPELPKLQPAVLVADGEHHAADAEHHNNFSAVRTCESVSSGLGAGGGFST